MRVKTYFSLQRVIFIHKGTLYSPALIQTAKHLNDEPLLQCHVSESESIRIIHQNVLLTFRGTLILVIPHHQQFSQAGHLGDFCDDPEKTLDAIVGQHHRCEARRPWRDQWQEEGAVYAGPLLRETKRLEKRKNCLGCTPNTLFVFHVNVHRRPRFKNSLSSPVCEVFHDSLGCNGEVTCSNSTNSGSYYGVKLSGCRSTWVK